MTLIKCPKCDGLVSSETHYCIYCGYSISEKISEILFDNALLELSKNTLYFCNALVENNDFFQNLMIGFSNKPSDDNETKDWAFDIYNKFITDFNSEDRKLQPFKLRATSQALSLYFDHLKEIENLPIYSIEYISYFEKTLSSINEMCEILLMCYDDFSKYPMLKVDKKKIHANDSEFLILLDFVDKVQLLSRSKLNNTFLQNITRLLQDNTDLANAFCYYYEKKREMTMAYKINISEIRKACQSYPHNKLLEYISSNKIGADCSSDELLQITQCVYARTFTECMLSAYNIPLTYDKNGILHLNSLVEFLISFYYILGESEQFSPWGKHLLKPVKVAVPNTFTPETFIKVCNTLFLETTNSYRDSIKNNSQKRPLFEYIHELYHNVFWELRSYIVAYVGEVTINKYGGYWKKDEIGSLIVIGDNGSVYDIGDSVDYRLFRSNISFFSLLM